MRSTSLIGAVLLASLAAAAPAQAAIVSPTGVRFPRIAVNAAGATVVAWERRTKGMFAIEARSGAGPSRLGPIHRLAARGFQPQVAIGVDGTRAVQWLARDGDRIQEIRVSVARPGHGFGRAQVIYRRRGTMAPSGVVVQPNGRVVAVFRPRLPDRLAFTVAPRNRRFAHNRALGIIGSAEDSAIALDPRDGAVVLAASTPATGSPPTNPQASVRTLPMSAADFSAPTVVSDSASLAEARPTIVSGSGATGVAYIQTGFTRAGLTTTLSLVRRTGDGSWGPREVIARPDLDENVFVAGLKATLPTGGGALAAWTIDTEARGLGSSIHKQTVASIAPPGAPFGAPAAVTPAGELYGASAVASADADAFLATAKAHGPVLLATRAAGATTLRTRTIASDGDGDVALAAAGSHVLLAYQRDDRLRLTTVR